MVYVFLANGFEEIEALAFVDILRRADIDVKTVSIYDYKSVTGSHDITVISDITLDDVNKNDMQAVVLPGGMPGTLNLNECEMVKDLILYAYNNDKYIGAICAAPMILGEMDLLNGKDAICYPGFEEHLLGANIVNTKAVVSGKIITSKGAGAASDFAHSFITHLKNKETADKVISSMQY